MCCLARGADTVNETRASINIDTRVFVGQVLGLILRNRANSE